MATPIVPITLADLTEAKVDGKGAFDTLMRAMVGHLEQEFKLGRLRGADYANVYLNSLTPVLQNATLFLLQKDEAANKAALVDAQVRLTEAQIALAEAELAREVLNKELIEAQIRKIDREIESADVADAHVVAQTNMITAQTANVSKEGLILDNQLTVSAKEIEKITADISMLGKQELNVVADTAIKTQQKLNMAEQLKQITAETAKATQELQNLIAQECLLRAQYDLTVVNKLQATAQTSLIQQKQATERAQIVETGVDENSVIGRQKTLYKAQADGFQRDAEQKAAKLLVDSWSVRRTTDSGTVADSTNMLNDATVGRMVTKLLTGVQA